MDYLMGRISKDAASGCWNWTRALDGKGYGMFTNSGRLPGTMRIWRAHRAAYHLLVGPIANGLHLHHHCNNRRCVNPEHLEPVTPQVHNVELTPGCYSYEMARKTHCVRGHPLIGDNLIPRSRWQKGRSCRECMREHDRKRNAIRGQDPEYLRKRRDWYERTRDERNAYARRQYAKKRSA